MSNNNTIEISPSKEESLDYILRFVFDLLKISGEEELLQFLFERIKDLEPESPIVMDSISEDRMTITITAIHHPNKGTVQKVFSLLQNNVIGREFKVKDEDYYYGNHGRLEVHNDSLYDLCFGQIPRAICNALEGLFRLDKIFEISLGTENSIMGGAIIILREGQKIQHKELIEILFRIASESLHRMRAYSRLDKSEFKYRTLAENAGDWIISLDLEGNHLYVNNAVAQALKVKTDQIVGKHCNELYPPDYANLIVDHLKKCIQNGQRQKCEIKLDIHDRSDFYDWVFNPIKSISGDKIEHVLVNARNVTERKEGEGKLLDNISHRNRLYSILSHDLKNSFGSIVGFSDLLETDYDELEPDKVKEFVGFISKSTRDSLELLESILDWSRKYDSIESNRPVFFNLASVVDSIVNIYAANILQKKLIIKQRGIEDTLVHADYNIVHTILRNLLSNAIKFSNTGGEVIISTLMKKGKLYCVVEDFGLGVSQENINRILHSNEHFTTNGSEGEKGSGLGMKFVRDMITSYNGVFDIESTEGEGSKVYFSLPS